MYRARLNHFTCASGSMMVRPSMAMLDLFDTKTSSARSGLWYALAYREIRP